MPTPARLPHPLVVLVVDDDGDTADSCAELLSLHGHTVLVALNGTDALRQTDARLPDVILLDLQMPGLDGYEAAREILRYCGAGRRPFLVAVTGHGTAGDHVRTTAAGFDLHLTKPVEPAILVGLLERFRRLLGPPTPASELGPPVQDDGTPCAPGEAPGPLASRADPGPDIRFRKR